MPSHRQPTRSLPLPGRWGRAPAPTVLLGESGPVITQKLGRYHLLFDSDQDGILERSDYERMALEVNRVFTFAPGCRQHHRTLRYALRFWELFATSEHDRLNLDDFTQVYLYKLSAERPRFLTTLKRLVDTFIALADTDGDGQVSPSEYRMLLQAAFNVPLEESARAYRKLDLDGSGFLEHHEIHQAVVDYFTSEDPDVPGNWLLGRPTWIAPDTAETSDQKLEHLRIMAEMEQQDSHLGSSVRWRMDTS